VSTGDPAGEGLAAALIQLAAHAERIGGLDTREAGHHQELTASLHALAAELAELTSQAQGIDDAVARHTAILDGLDGLGRQVETLADRLAMMNVTGADDAPGYQPVPPPRWWQLTGADREAAVDRLAAWVEQIYVPGYGRLAAALPPCWREHTVCLFALDWLSELWSVLYLDPDRNAAALAAQAEWQTRLLPAAAEQMTLEASNCPHHTRSRPRPLPDYPAD
jgi:hypothetical protein